MCKCENTVIDRVGFEVCIDCGIVKSNFVLQFDDLEYFRDLFKPVERITLFKEIVPIIPEDLYEKVFINFPIVVVDYIESFLLKSLK